MKISHALAVLVLFGFSTTLAMADSVDTRWQVEDPSGPSGTFPVVITSNQFVTDPDGGFTLSGIYNGAPIYSLEFVIPKVDIVGPLTCTSNVFLVKTIQPVGNNPGVCFFETTTSLGIAKFFPPDLTGSDDTNGFDCSLSDLDDCIGIQPGHVVDLSIPDSSPAVGGAPFDLAANGAAPLPFPEAGSGLTLLFGCAGLLVAAARFKVARFVGSQTTNA